MKLLEEIEKKEALDKYGSEGSGKNLPFSSLSEDLKKKEKNRLRNWLLLNQSFYINFLRLTQIF